MSEPSDDRDPFEVVAESFLARFRAGQRPSIEEYAASHPELADQIRELLPALVMVEQDLTVDRNPAPGGSRVLGPPSSSKERRLGDYRILREVGRGGMGVVYEAEQVSLGRRVALKVLPGHLASDVTGLERFRREAKAAARLHHTNIVPVYEVGRDGEVAYYAMQFIQGQGLDQVIDELARLGGQASKPGGAEGHLPTAVAAAVGPAIGRIAESLLSGGIAPEGTAPTADIPPATPDGPAATEPIARDATRPPGLVPVSREPARPGATSDPGSRAMLPGGSQASTTYLSGRRSTYFRSVAGIGRQAAQGLAYAHAGGIVHRDIKPSNLLLDHAGVVWIADFGLAKADDDGLTQSGDILGTLRYMAPERFRGQGDARADVYALGLTLYELLTLRPAFDSADRLKLIERINAEEPRRPRDVDPRVPRDLETIVLKAIEKDPRARYQSAEAMAEDLRLFLANEPIRARQVSTSERYWRWARRNPAIAALGGVLMALLVATSVGSMWAASYFRALAGSESLANRQSQLAQKQAVQAREAADDSRQQALLERDRSRRLSAGLALDKGVALAEEGHADRGLLWMLEALKTAPDDAEKFRTTVRANLAAWLGQVPRPLRIFENGPGFAMAFSPDGRTFAQADAHNDGTLARSVSLRDTDSGRELASFPDAYRPFAFRPDGRALIAGTKDRKRLAAFDLATGRAIWESPDLPGDAGRTISFGANASTIFVECDRGSHEFEIIPLDGDTGRRRGDPIRSLGQSSLAPDARTMATVRLEDGRYHVDIIDTASSRRKISWEVGPEMIFSLGFSPDGKSLSVGTTSNRYNHKSGNTQVWDPIGGRPMSRPIPDAIDGRYNLPGDRLILERDFNRAMLDASGMQRGSRFAVGGPFALHPDGRTVLSHASDYITRLWQISADAQPIAGRGSPDASSMPSDPMSRKPRLYLPFQGGRLRSDGQLAALLVDASGGRELIRLVDPSTMLPLGKPLPHYSGWIVRSLAFGPDGRRFATASNRPDQTVGVIRLCDAKTGRLLIPPIAHTNHVAALAFHPDGKILAAGDYNGLVRFWDTATGREIGRPLSQGEIVLGLAYSPDGTILAVGLTNEHKKPGVRLWDAATRRPIGELLPSVDNVDRIVFRPDGGAFLGGNSQSARLWDMKLRSDIGEPMVGEAVGVFRPDGRAFLTLGRDGSVKLRDAASGTVVSKPVSATSPATCAAFRGDGDLVVAGFDDGAIRLLDLATSQQIGPTLSMKSSVETVGFSPDGRNIYAIDRSGEFRKWPVHDPLRDASFDDLTLRLEARTGLRLDASLAISRLDPTAWRERLERLGRLDPAALKVDDGPAWHEPMAREAERTGNAFAAIWHLDRLIAARPDDWLLHARRARAWSLSDEFEKAAADYQRAEQLGHREEVLDFQDHHVVECLNAGRWPESLWHLDRLIAARPDDVSLRENRATACGKLGREADRQAELARVFELGADEEMVIRRAAELGRDGRWPEAASLLARCGRQSFISKDFAQAWGIACLRAGDRAGYREVCAAVMAREGPNPTVFWNALGEASLLALAPGAIEDYRMPIAYYERRLSAIPASAPLFRRLISNAQGGLLLRAGRIDEAIALIEGGISAAKEPELPTDWALLALAHARKGSFAEARRWLDRLRGVRQAPSDSPWDLQELALLREEAESLLSDAAFPSDPFRRPGPR